MKRKLFLSAHKIEHRSGYGIREFGKWAFLSILYSFMWPIIENIGIKIPERTLLQSFLLYTINYYCHCCAC